MQGAIIILLACVVVALIVLIDVIASKKKEIITVQAQLQGLSVIPDWTIDEVRVLRRFLDSAVGKTLMARARAVEYQSAIAAARDPMHTVHSAARTAGFSDCLTWIESLASDKLAQTLSGASAAQDANHSTDPVQNEGEQVAVRRSF